jgi:hypothetical protein
MVKCKITALLFLILNFPLSKSVFGSLKSTVVFPCLLFGSGYVAFIFMRTHTVRYRTYQSSQDRVVISDATTEFWTTGNTLFETRSEYIVAYLLYPLMPQTAVFFYSEWLVESSPKYILLFAATRQST